MSRACFGGAPTTPRCTPDASRCGAQAEADRIAAEQAAAAAAAKAAADAAAAAAAKSAAADSSPAKKMAAKSKANPTSPAPPSVSPPAATYNGITLTETDLAMQVQQAGGPDRSNALPPIKRSPHAAAPTQPPRSSSHAAPTQPQCTPYAARGLQCC